eukprot:gene16186-22011_t
MFSIFKKTEKSNNDNDKIVETNIKNKKNINEENNTNSNVQSTRNENESVNDDDIDTVLSDESNQKGKKKKKKKKISNVSFQEDDDSPLTLDIKKINKNDTDTNNDIYSDDEVEAMDDNNTLPSINENKSPQSDNGSLSKQGKKKKKKDKAKLNDSNLPQIDASNCWVKKTDESDNIYYYNTETFESTWLAPCVICKLPSIKWCIDCEKPYCEYDHNMVHLGRKADHSFQFHVFSTTEQYREDIGPDESHCVSCTTKKATKMCLTCWDPYCDNCCTSSHAVGALKFHKISSYKRAKMNWICVKVKGTDDIDYYINGTSGEKVKEKPEELMNDVELTHFKNFKAHQTAAEEYVKTIEKLQFELESAKYERDKIMVELFSLKEQQASDSVTGVSGKGGKANSNLLDNIKGKKSKAGFSLFKTDDTDYKEKLMSPTDRRRGQARTELIKGLLDQPPV